MTTLGIIGSTAGTLAWYAYSRSTRVNFVGTSVAKSALLNVGIVDGIAGDPSTYTISDDFRTAYELSREEFDGKSIVFTHKTDGIDYRVLHEYLFHSPYAVNLLFPVTTQSRNLLNQGDLNLYESPSHGVTNITAHDADPAHYVKLPLAFRMTDTNSENIHGKSVWLTSANAKASGGVDIEQSLRLFIENSQRKFLVKPSDNGTTIGRTYVGGLLDLDGDGTYDYNTGSGYELYYGQKTGEEHYAGSRYGEPKETAPYDNVNHVTNTIESTFYSKHNENAYCLDLSYLTPAYVEYYPFGLVKPDVDADGNYFENTENGHGMMMCLTDSTDGVGYVTFTIFIEGWDHVVIDQAANYSFNLSLKFEVNKES